MGLYTRRHATYKVDSMDDNLIRFWEAGPLAIIQLNRQDKSNAYNQSMLNSLKQYLNEFETKSKYRGLIIHGAGERAFCAGADLTELNHKDYKDALDLESASCFNALAASTKITIAAINGAAVGGGLELALSCDLRICSDNATFRFPEITHGLIPAAGGTQRLTHVVGRAMAIEMILGGCTWLAERAYAHGLVSKIVQNGALLEEAQKWGNAIAQYSPLALRLAKQAINASIKNTTGFQLETVSEALLYELRNKDRQ